MERKAYIHVFDGNALQVNVVNIIDLLTIKSLSDRTKDLEDVLYSKILNQLNKSELLELKENIITYKDYTLNPESGNMHYREVINEIYIILRKGDNKNG